MSQLEIFACRLLTLSGAVFKPEADFVERCLARSELGGADLACMLIRGISSSYSSSSGVEGCLIVTGFGRTRLERLFCRFVLLLAFLLGVMPPDEFGGAIEARLDRERDSLSEPDAVLSFCLSSGVSRDADFRPSPLALTRVSDRLFAGDLTDGVGLEPLDREDDRETLTGLREVAKADFMLLMPLLGEVVFLLPLLLLEMPADLERLWKDIVGDQVVRSPADDGGLLLLLCTALLSFSRPALMCLSAAVTYRNTLRCQLHG